MGMMFLAASADAKCRKEIADQLRGFAKSIETGETREMNLIRLNHTEDVMKPEYGNMIVDQRYLGHTMIFTTMFMDQRTAEMIRRIIEGGSGR